MTAPGQDAGPHLGDDVAQAPARGRPRSEKARKAILEAAAELLLGRGLGAVSMDAVAERAGVSKATIYRWWPTKETLALDALYTRWAAAAPVPRDTGSLRGDLLELLQPWVKLVRTGPHAQVIAALLTEARTDPVFAAEYRRHVIQPRREQAKEIFERAVARGEVPADLDLEVALDLIYGPLYHRLLQGHAPLGDAFVHAVVGLVLAGITHGGEFSGGFSGNSLVRSPLSRASVWLTYGVSRRSAGRAPVRNTVVAWLTSKEPTNSAPATAGCSSRPGARDWPPGRATI